MLDLKSFVISLPASAVKHMSFRGSVFEANEILKFPLAPDLRLALDVVTSVYQGMEPLRCIARPEMFTHGVALKWLKEKLGDVSNHLGLSDGSTIKLIPDFQNHLFAYGLQSRKRQFSFRQLLVQAPEVLSQCASQINSYHCSIVGVHDSEPPAQHLMMLALRPNTNVWFYGFYLNPHSVDDSINHMMSWGDFGVSKLEQFKKVIYVPITECSLHDLAFQRYLADVIVSTYFDLGVCLLMRLPPQGVDLVQRIKLAMESICVTGRRLPRVRAINVYFVAEDLAELTLRPLAAKLCLILHHSFEYWRYTGSLYQNSGAILFFFAHENNDISNMGKLLLAKSFGQEPTFMSGSRLLEVDMPLI